MEQSNPTKIAKPKTVIVSTVGLRVKRETKKKALSDLAKINKKDFGRNIRVDELIALALSLVEPKHVRELQERSLSNADRLERQFQDYIKVHGSISKDAFLGKLLAGEVPSVSAPNTAKPA